MVGAKNMTDEEKQKYKEAAQRQLLIAWYFLGKLVEKYCNAKKFEDFKAKDMREKTKDDYDIRTQAYFEGCVKALFSALDKSCEGKLTGKSKKDNGIPRFGKYYSPESKIAWKHFFNKEINDEVFEELEILRLLRNDVTHNFTQKNAEDGNLQIYFKHNKNETDYTGAKPIKDFTKDAYKIVKQLVESKIST